MFLIDTQDESDNVLNEIAWTARSNKSVFVVFNTKGEGHSAEFEAIQVSSIHLMYSGAAGNPEVLGFGYHFVTHESDEGLDWRLTSLANRIMSYLEKVRRGEVGRIRMDTEMTMSDNREYAVCASAPSIARRTPHQFLDFLA